MKPLPAFALLAFFILSTVIAEAGEQTLSPDNGHSNQNQINAALERGNVYLQAGVYEIDNTIVMPSNRVLSGDSNAIIRVSSTSSQWFTGSTGVISCSGIANNIEISGFQMDGNIGNLPKSYANSRSDTDHDCQKLIILRGASNQFAQNIRIHHLKLYNSFSDGIFVIFGDNVQCYDNFISNTQHEGIYFSCLKNSVMYRNKIAGICSDAARLDNCVNCKVYDNLFFSYNGESYGQYKGGQAGLQVANSASSHGYDASKKPQMTDRVEITNNTFADPGRQAIWLHNYDGSVFVHDNEFIDSAGLETQGIPVGDISVDNPPSVEDTEAVFNSIFDFLKRDYIFQYPAIQRDFDATATVTYCNNSAQPYALVEVNGDNLKVVKVQYAGKEAKHFLERDIWTGELSHAGQEVYLPGNYQPGELKITVYGESGFQKVENIDVREVILASVGINPDLFIFIAILAILGITTYRNIKRVL